MENSKVLTMKPLLIYLADPVHNFIKSCDNWFIPLGVLNVASYIKSAFGDKINVRLFKFPDEVFRAIEKESPDIIGVSNYIWNSELSKNILQFSKDRNPKTITVMGGPNITETISKMTRLLKDGACDYYISGAGEHPFKCLVGSMLHSHGSGVVPNEDPALHGIWYLDESQKHACFKPIRHTIKNLDEIPSPFLNGMVNKFFEQGLAPMLETNKGCPFFCTYCVWGNKSRIYKLSVDRCFADIEYCRSQSNGNGLLMLTDANFGILGKRDLKIARFIGDSHRRYGWPSSVIVNWGQVKSDIALRVAESLKDVSIFRQSSQSMNAKVLKNIKRKNISHVEWKRIVEYSKTEGIESFGELIVMLPGETMESYIDALRYLFDLDVNCINTNQLQLLEGAEINSPEERKKWQMETRWRLLENAYGTYCGRIAIESEEVVIQTNSFTSEESLVCRTINWLIQMSWTLRRHYLLICLIRSFGVNPVDFFLRAAREYRNAGDPVRTLFERFEKDAKEELFSSKEELVSFWSKPEQIRCLREGGFRKLNTHYSALVTLSCNSDFVNYYVSIALEIVRELACAPKNYDEMVCECARYVRERCFEEGDITEFKAGKDIRKDLTFCYDILSWSRDTTQKGLMEYQCNDGVKYQFYTTADQRDAIKNHMRRFSGLSGEYQLRKLHEPYFGINKKHLLFKVRPSEVV